MLERARNARLRVAIDGCEDQCCKRVLGEADLPVDIHVVATDLGIETQPDEPHLMVDTEKIVAGVAERLSKGDGQTRKDIQP